MKIVLLNFLGSFICMHKCEGMVKLSTVLVHAGRISRGQPRVLSRDLIATKRSSRSALKKTLKTQTVIQIVETPRINFQFRW